MEEHNLNNKRIAKNTVFLYIRTFVIMLITLYTSRVILNVLGVEDYGVYNAVGGVVSMFNLLTVALSAAISRFITYELGKNGNDVERLSVIFSTSIRIQLLLSVLILFLGELFGVWFLNSYMNIPTDRLSAANWVWQCCLFSFIINLLSVPYNSSIIAHEHMNAFAIISIIDASLRLGICYLIVISPLDKLATYAVLNVTVALIIRIMYGYYCSKNFFECKYTHKKDKSLTKSMFGFASFSFLNNSVSIFNHQGINLLVNLFWGVLFNAARGIATQVEGAVMQLVNNLTVAINPQITKSYAKGDKERMFNLICTGSKFSYYLLLFFALPLFIETDFILKIWLNIVPEYTALFLRLAIIGAMIKMLGNTGYTACMATGNIKKYSIWITVFGITAFPLTYLAYKLGYPVESAYYAYILAYIMVEIVRLVLMKEMLGFPPIRFVKEVLFNACIVTLFSTIIPFVVFYSFSQGILRLFGVLVSSMISTAFVLYFIGLKHSERSMISSLFMRKFAKLK